MNTWLVDTFGLRVPVVSAPMAGVAGGRLAAAVSSAGGLGLVGVGRRSTPDWVAEQCAVAAGAGARWGVGLQAWAMAAEPGQLDAALAARPDLVSVSYGDYARYVDRIHDAGCVMVTTAGNLREALEAEQAGVDAIVARGGEGGGHGRNDVATLPLLQTVLDAVQVPVLAAGGIATSRGLAAVLAAGAAGAWVGTAFLTCVEGTSTDATLARLVSAADTDTVYGRVFDLALRSGWPAEFGERALRNGFFDSWAGREVELSADEAAHRELTAATERDDPALLRVQAGQGVALLRSQTDAATVMEEFAGFMLLLAGGWSP